MYLASLSSSNSFTRTRIFSCFAFSRTIFSQKAGCGVERETRQSLAFLFLDGPVWPFNGGRTEPIQLPKFRFAQYAMQVALIECEMSSRQVALPAVTLGRRCASWRIDQPSLTHLDSYQRSHRFPRCQAKKMNLKRWARGRAARPTG